jgi:hypothetical protein
MTSTTRNLLFDVYGVLLKAGWGELDSHGQEEDDRARLETLANAPPGALADVPREELKDRMARALRQVRQELERRRKSGTQSA